jgi:hypothetical protein
MTDPTRISSLRRFPSFSPACMSVRVPHRQVQVRPVIRSLAVVPRKCRGLRPCHPLPPQCLAGGATRVVSSELRVRCHLVPQDGSGSTPTARARTWAWRSNTTSWTAWLGRTGVTVSAARRTRGTVNPMHTTRRLRRSSGHRSIQAITLLSTTVSRTTAELTTRGATASVAAVVLVVRRSTARRRT